MARPKGTSRVTGPGGTSPDAPYVEPKFPSFRERKPLMYWTIVIAVLAMVISTVGSIALAFA
ncbi:MAG: hypothetical protein AAF547_03325 [Actinomycetota bacterium]